MEGFNNYALVGYVNQNGIYNQVNQQVGYTLEQYNTLRDICKESQKKAEEYKKMLEDAGIIEKQKTPEELQAIMLNMAKTIQTLNEKITNLENNNVQQRNNTADCTNISVERKDGSTIKSVRHDESDNDCSTKSSRSSK